MGRAQPHHSLPGRSVRGADRLHDPRRHRPQRRRAAQRPAGRPAHRAPQGHPAPLQRNRRQRPSWNLRPAPVRPAPARSQAVHRPPAPSAEPAAAADPWLAAQTGAGGGGERLAAPIPVPRSGDGGAAGGSTGLVGPAAALALLDAGRHAAGGDRPAGKTGQTTKTAKTAAEAGAVAAGLSDYLAGCAGLDAAGLAQDTALDPLALDAATPPTTNRLTGGVADACPYCSDIRTYWPPGGRLRVLPGDPHQLLALHHRLRAVTLQQGQADQ